MCTIHVAAITHISTHTCTRNDYDDNDIKNNNNNFKLVRILVLVCFYSQRMTVFTYTDDISTSSC